MPILEKIVVSNFRNIEFQEIMFSPNVNCISGNNGEGKTNLLDAIYYLSMTKSAFSTSDRYVFRYGTDSFSIGGTYIMESRSGEEPLRARFSIYVGSGGEKKFKKDDKPYERISSHIGELPIVMVSPSSTTGFCRSVTACSRTGGRTGSCWRYSDPGCPRTHRGCTKPDQSSLKP